MSLSPSLQSKGGLLVEFITDFDWDFFLFKLMMTLHCILFLHRLALVDSYII